MSDAPLRSGLEPSKLDLDFAHTAARWRLHRLSFRDVEDFATLALMRGFDGPALCELAWRQDSWVKVDALFPQAFTEMGLAVPSDVEAITQLAQEIAEDIGRGTMSVLEGAREIRALYFQFGYDRARDVDWPRLNPWALDALLDELEYVGTEHLPEIERDLLAIVLRLLDMPPEAAEEHELSPTLGGARAAVDLPAGAPEAPYIEREDRFGFDWSRLFTWHGWWRSRR